MSEIKLIQGEEVLRVQVLAGEFEYAKGTKMEGKTYRRFGFAGKVFISNDETLANELKAGNVAEMELGVNEEGQYSLNSWVSWSAKNNIKRRMCEYQAITVESFKPTSVKQYETLA